MPSAIDLLREVLTLTTNVERLQKDLDGVAQILQRQIERIAKLENSGELIAERSMRAASDASARSLLPLLERILNLEHAIQHRNAAMIAGPGRDAE